MKTGAVNEVRFRSIARKLAEDRNAPAWFVDLEYINWHGTYKDLSFISQVTISYLYILPFRPLLLTLSIVMTLVIFFMTLVNIQRSDCQSQSRCQRQNRRCRH